MVPSLLSECRQFRIEYENAPTELMSKRVILNAALKIWSLYVSENHCKNRENTRCCRKFTIQSGSEPSVECVLCLSRKNAKLKHVKAEKNFFKPIIKVPSGFEGNRRGGTLRKRPLFRVPDREVWRNTLDTS